MTSLRRTSRHISCALAILGLGMGSALTACGQSEPGKPAASSSAQPPAQVSASPAASAAYDISRVDAVKGDFPPGFSADPHPTKTLSQQDIDKSGVVALTKAKVDPPQCRPLIIPPFAEPTAGTQAAGVQAQGDQGKIDVVAMRMTRSIPAGPLPAGCDKASLSGSPDGPETAERVPGPSIDGVTTTGVMLSPADDDDPDYIFTAALNDQTTIVVMGSADDALNPQQMLSDLLVKATAAVRG